MGFLSSLAGDLTGGLIGESSAERAARRAGNITQAGAEADIAARTEAAAPFTALGVSAAGQLPGSVLEGEFIAAGEDPSVVLDDPFFGALAGQQEQRLLNQAASRGRAGAGGTKDRLQQNLLLLGDRFRRQNFQERLQANQQRFGQLFGVTQLGANAAIGTGRDVGNIRSDLAGFDAASEIALANERAGGVRNLVSAGTAFATGGGSLPFSLGDGGGGGGGFSNIGFGGGGGLDPSFGDFSNVGF